MVDGVNGGRPAMPVRTAGPQELGGSAATRLSGASVPAAGSPAAASKPPIGSADVRGLVQDMSARPPVNAERVAALQQQIAGGSYKIDAERLADAMIAQERGSDR